jgi:hypothetical protein
MEPSHVQGPSLKPVKHIDRIRVLSIPEYPYSVCVCTAIDSAPGGHTDSRPVSLETV